MNQPELGRKIAELRKSKGLTQEELVKQCNLSVRTLQRIESGEVMPRFYTIKSIFEALDVQVENYSTVTNEQEQDDSEQETRLQQIYKYITELFNLKKNTMKKLVLLSLLTIGIAFSFTLGISAQNKSKNNNNLIGTWILCTSTGEIPNSDVVEIKIITNKSFTVIHRSESTKAFVGLFNGTYTLDKDTYKEQIIYANSQNMRYVGQENTFSSEFKDGKWYIVGTNNKYNQIWHKLE